MDVLSKKPHLEAEGFMDMGQGPMALYNPQGGPCGRVCILGQYCTLTSTVFPPLNITRRRTVGLRAFFKLCSFEVLSHILFVDPIRCPSSSCRCSFSFVFLFDFLFDSFVSSYFLLLNFLIFTLEIFDIE